MIELQRSPLAPGLGLGRIERLSVYSSRRQSHVRERNLIVKAHPKEGVERFLQPRRCGQDTATHSYRVRVCERWRSTIDNSDTRIIPAPVPKDERFRGITR